MAQTSHKNFEVREAKYGPGYEVIVRAESGSAVVARTFSPQTKELAECVAKLIESKKIV